jgi:hypothetical protein
LLLFLVLDPLFHVLIIFETNFMVVIYVEALDFFIEFEELVKALIVRVLLVQFYYLTNCHKLVVHFISVAFFVLIMNENLTQEFEIRVVFVQLFIQLGVFIHFVSLRSVNRLRTKQVVVVFERSFFFLFLLRHRV